LERDWYLPLRQQHGLPPLSRLWGLAQHLRDRWLARKLSDDDLFALVAETLWYCVQRFDEHHPPRKGLCRLGTQDRFSSYFGRKLAWELKSLLRSRKRRRRPRPLGRYRGPRADRYQNVPQPRSKAAMFQLLHRAMGQLDRGDQDLVERRFWGRATWEDIAVEFGLSSRFQAARRVEQAQDRLKSLVLEELQDAVVGAEDDFNAVGAVLAA
jgi:hypothetical protein